MRFQDRVDAGRQLARALQHHAGAGALVLALPRGGVVVGAEVARALDAPLDVIIARKLGAPGQPELGFGAIAEDGSVVTDPTMVRMLGLSPAEISDLARDELREATRRVARYRHGRPLPRLGDRNIILVDDGIATGGTVRAALRALHRAGARHVVLAVPVGPPDTIAALRRETDEVVCVLQPEDLRAVGAWYDDFPQTTDEEVEACLAQAGWDSASPAQADPVALTIEAEGARLHGDLVLPARARGLVVFAHGSGSSRRSPRNRAVALVLQQAGLGTLLVDLLTEEEEQIDARTRAYRFDIGLLSRRLVGILDWLTSEPDTRDLSLGCFGASTGATAALWAAAARPSLVRAVVSRGGRPDLAAEALSHVYAPTLLLVGGRDAEVLQDNQAALARMPCVRSLSIVQGATHLFEEPGTLEELARRATRWFVDYLPLRPESVPPDAGEATTG